jgi:phosphoribosylformylglycinamidine synthase
VFLRWIGNTGGDSLVLGAAAPIRVERLREAHESWFPRFMGERQAA